MKSPGLTRRPARAAPRPLSPRQRVLAQWRGVNLAPLEEARTLRARPLAQLTPGLLQSLGIERRRGETEIVKVWNRLLDPQIVAHAQPVGLRNGTLFVNVDNSAWLSEIVRYRRKEILERLQHSFGREVIQRLSFRIG